MKSRIIFFIFCFFFSSSYDPLIAWPSCIKPARILSTIKKIPSWYQRAQMPVITRIAHAGTVFSIGRMASSYLPDGAMVALPWLSAVTFLHSMRWNFLAHPFAHVGAFFTFVTNLAPSIMDTCERNSLRETCGTPIDASLFAGTVVFSLVASYFLKNMTKKMLRATNIPDKLENYFFADPHFPALIAEYKTKKYALNNCTCTTTPCSCEIPYKTLSHEQAAVLCCIAQGKIKPWTVEETENTCCICLENQKGGINLHGQPPEQDQQEVKNETFSPHILCIGCLEKLPATHNTCPFCREKFPE
jgi:hypothetical protein